MDHLPSHSALWVSAGCMMVHLFCAGVIVGLFVFALRRVLPARYGPGPRYRLTLGCLVVLVISPAVLLPCIETRVRAPSDAPTVMPAWLDSGEDEPVPEVWAGAESSGNSSAGAITGRQWSLRDFGEAVLADNISRLFAWASVQGPWIWLSGVAVMAAFTAGGLLGLRRTCLQATPENGCVQARADAICAGMGLRPIQVKLSDLITSPTLVGWCRPVILLPGAARHAWTPHELEMVLLHEITHARRRDNLINLLQCVFEIAFFFNPAVWYLSRCVHTDREEICDRAVLARTGRQLAYAQLLLGFTRFPAGSRMAMGMGEHNLVSRIRCILQPDRPSRRSCRGVIWTVGALGIALFSMGAFAVVAAVPLPRVGVPEAGTSPLVPIGSATNSSAARPAEAASTNPGMSFLLMDSSGQPVAGALAGTNVLLRNGLPIQDDAALVISDAQGLASCPARVKGDAMRQFYFHDPARQLVGAVGLTSPSVHSPVPVLMTPACRVRVTLQVPGGDSLTWAKCFVRIVNPGASCRVNDLYLLRQTQSSASGPWQFEYDLPPGQYELVAFGGDESSKMPRTRAHVQCFDLPAGVASLDLGIFRISMK